jgi:hypothetical protein
MNLDRILAKLETIDLDIMDPDYWGATFNVAPDEVREAIDRRRKEITDLELLKARPEMGGD